MKTRLLILPILFSLFFSPVSADLVTEGEVTVMFRLTNINEFDDYEFFVLYQSYYYDEGYQPGDIDTMMIEKSIGYTASGRGGKSYLYARNKETGKISKSEVLLGGKDYVDDYELRNVTQDYQIKKIEGGEIVLKEKRLHKGAVEEEYDEDNDEVDGFWVVGGWLYWVLPAACFVLLVAFFMFRRRSKGSLSAAASN